MDTRGEPDLRDYLKASEASKAQLEHVVMPGNQDSPTPYHYVVVRVDGEKLSLEVMAVDWGRGFGFFLAPPGDKVFAIRESRI